MGQKVSTSPRVRTNYAGPLAQHHQLHGTPHISGLDESTDSMHHHHHHLAMGSGTSTTTSNGDQAHRSRGSFHQSTSYAASVASSHQQQQRSRARSLGGNAQNGSSSSTSSPGVMIPGFIDLSLGQDSDDSSPEDNGLALPVTRSRGRTFPFHAQSLPAHLFNAPTLLQHVQQGIKCPVCSKFVPPDDVECHLVICLTKPRIVYNEDVLSADTGECVICLEDMQQGNTIARLPCLCIYHKSCIDMWFERNRSCPEHPSD